MWDQNATRLCLTKPSASNVGRPWQGKGGKASARSASLLKPAPARSTLLRQQITTIRQKQRRPRIAVQQNSSCQKGRHTRVRLEITSCLRKLPAAAGALFIERDT